MKEDTPLDYFSPWEMVMRPGVLVIRQSMLLVDSICTLHSLVFPFRKLASALYFRKLPGVQQELLSFYKEHLDTTKLIS